MSTLDPHPRFNRLKEQLRSICPHHVEPWRKTSFRCVEPKWARPEYLISGEGTKTHGGRWMRKGLTPAVYAASTEAIALKEAQYNFSRYGFKPRQNPRVLIDLELDLNATIPMAPVLEDLPWPSLDELLDEDWEAVNESGTESLSQAFGRALWELEYEGLRVPSTRDRRGSNLAWFPERLKPESEIIIVGKAELRRWIAK